MNVQNLFNQFVSKAATYGGAALLGSLAHKAYRNWQQANSDHPAEQVHLDQLAQVLQLPDGLAEQLQRQARMD